MVILLMIFGIAGFIGLIMIHEFGHFTMARRNGVETEEFGLGFPPRLYGRKRAKKTGDKTLYSINLLPLGGFVKLKGEHDEDGGKGSFGAASLRNKTKILLAGVSMNLITALVLFTIVALLGMPVLITKDQFNEDQFAVKSDSHLVKTEVRIQYVEPGSPADKAGIKPGDTLHAVGSIACDNYSCDRIEKSQDLKLFTQKYQSLPLKIEYSREGKTYNTTAQLRSTEQVEVSKNTDNPKGYLGVQPSDYTINRFTWGAPIVAVGVTKQITILTFKGLWKAIKGLGSTIAGTFTGNKLARQKGQTEASEQVSGPLGIFFVLKIGAAQGFAFILFILAIISLTLAIMNVLPIPALDGGRLYLLLFWRLVLKKPLTQKTEERVVGTSFAALMFLFVLITVVDIKRFF